MRRTRLDELIVDQVILDFFAADIGEHFAVDLNTGRKGLATFRFHFPAKSRVLDDVFLGVRQIVFGEHGTNAGAPAAGGFQISSDLGRIHLWNDNTPAQNFSRDKSDQKFFRE